MTKRAFEKIKAGLDDARAYLDGKRRSRATAPEAISSKKKRSVRKKRTAR